MPQTPDKAGDHVKVIANVGPAGLSAERARANCKASLARHREPKRRQHLFAEQPALGVIRPWVACRLPTENGGRCALAFSPVSATTAQQNLLCVGLLAHWCVVCGVCGCVRVCVVCLFSILSVVVASCVCCLCALSILCVVFSSCACLCWFVLSGVCAWCVCILFAAVVCTFFVLRVTCAMRM